MSTVRRVLMTADTAGGVFVFALELSRALAERGVEVLLAVMGAPPAADQRAEAESISGLRLVAEPFLLEWMEHPFDELARAGEWLRALAADLRPDVVHLNAYAHGAVSFGVPVVITGHSCVLSWWTAVLEEAPPDRWDRYARMVQAGLRGASAVVAPTEAMLASLERWYGPIPVKRRIFNGLTRESGHALEKQQLILSAGRLWDRAKAIDCLEDAQPLVRWPIYAAGADTSPDGKRVELRRVHALGSLPRAALAELMARAAIYVHPARYEPFGLTPLEAGLAECALVLGDIASLREIWEDDALYVRPGCSKSVARALDKLIEGEHLRRVYARRARIRAERFTAEKMGDEYLRLFEEVAR